MFFSQVIKRVNPWCNRLFSILTTHSGKVYLYEESSLKIIYQLYQRFMIFLNNYDRVNLLMRIFFEKHIMVPIFSVVKNAFKVLMNFMKQRTIPNILQNFPSAMKLMHPVISLLTRKA